jgi:hypothetical protein
MHRASPPPQLIKHHEPAAAVDSIQAPFNVTGVVQAALSAAGADFPYASPGAVTHDVDADDARDTFPSPSTATHPLFSIDWSTSSSESTATVNSVDENSWRASTTGVLLCLVIVFTLAGNSLVVVAVASTRRLRSSVTNYFVVSLAVADLTVAVLVMPYAVVYELYGRWTFGWIFCYFWISCDVTCCTASILHLCVVAVDRYLAVTEPLTYRSRMSKRRALGAIAAVWTCSSAISFVPVYAGWFVDDSATAAPTTTTSDSTSTEEAVGDAGSIVARPHMPLYEDGPMCGLFVNRTYAVVSSTTSFYLPLIVMLILYAKIFRIARRQSAEIRKLETAVGQQRMHLQSSSSSVVGGGRLQQRRTRRVTGDTKAVKTLGTLMGLFIASWLPFFVVYLVKPFGSGRFTVPADVEIAVTWLGYCNSFINPVVYAFLNRDFRSAFRRVILCGRLPPPTHDADGMIPTYAARRRTSGMSSASRRLTQNGCGGLEAAGAPTYRYRDEGCGGDTSRPSVVSIRLKIVQIPTQPKCSPSSVMPHSCSGGGGDANGELRAMAGSDEAAITYIGVNKP